MIGIFFNILDNLIRNSYLIVNNHYISNIFSLEL